MSETLPSYAVLILPVPIDRMFTYFIPEELRTLAAPGKRVIVQFGARKYYTGIIYELVNSVPEGITPKHIEHIIDDEPVVMPKHLAFWKWMADYYLCGPGDVMKAALPAGLRIESETKISLHDAIDDAQLQYLQQHEQMIVTALKERENLSIPEIQKLLGMKNVFHLVKNLLSKGIAVSHEEYAERFIPRTENFIQLAPEYERNEEKLLQLINQLSKKAPKQSDLLVYFIHETTVLQNTKELPKKLLAKRCSSQAIQTLIKKGVLIETTREVSRFWETGIETTLAEPLLSEDQQKAVESIQTSIAEKKVHLLHGITSSGKTEIYTHLIKKELEEGRQVLYLLPEIALTTQIIQRLRKTFGSQVGVYHHRYNVHEKIELWNSVIMSDAAQPRFRVILGTRSALFLPFTNLGLIIIDEEHDGSYKQSDLAPRYNARDAAIYLGKLLDAKILMGTATPSVETYFNVQQGRYGITELMSRYGNLPLPEVVIVDMRKEQFQRKGAWYISSVLRSAIEKSLEKKKQIILFQNRRGFAPVVQCTQCAWIPNCIHCDISLTYHKKQNHLRCHLCGYNEIIPDHCPVCGNTHIKFSGFGTEKVEEEIKVLFPQAVVARMDTDTTKGKHAHQNIIHAFESGETDILIGTQMVSKGLDFSRVQTVGILNADNLMNFPDFRAYERGFQLLTQIMGRAGRHDEPGQVVLQTRRPDHPVIVCAVHNDFQTFYTEQLKERYEFRYPPFYRLIVLSVQHKNLEKTNGAAHELKKLISAIPELIILGPEEPIYGRIKQYYIRNIMIKIPRTQKHLHTRMQIRKIISEFLALKNNSGVRIVADADPM